MISSQRELFDKAIRALSEAFGAVDLVSEIMDFDMTDYYNEQMGSPLYRRFVSFNTPVAPDALADAKVKTNEIEETFAASADSPGEPERPVNLDPGYVAPSKLVLASMKDFSHRIYLGRGVYAEITLMYRKGRWQPLAWTFPDYASGRYDAFLTEARSRLLTKGKEKAK
jgi:hypothetical protein